jgi:hypothetical protein
MPQPHLNPTVFCERCGAPIRKRKDRPSTFCSRACRYAPKALVPHPERDNLLLIPLSKGKVAVIDAADAGLVVDSFWKLNEGRWKSDYAYRDTPNGMQMLHSVILGLTDGTPVDHKDGDGLNNSRANLRLTTNSLNQANRGPNRNNTSGFKGVMWRKAEGIWVARIKVNGRLIDLGRYRDKVEAARAYDAAAIKHFGDHARLNLP